MGDNFTQDHRIQIVDIPNGGVSNARNIGLSLAKGEKIFFGTVMMSLNLILLRNVLICRKS